MAEEKNKCLFCNIPKEKIVTENKYAYAIHDGFPVTEHHSLIISKRHVEEYFGLMKEELFGCDSLLRTMRKAILAMDDFSIEGEIEHR